MTQSFANYLRSMAQRCSALAEKCRDEDAKEEIGAISVELSEYAEQLRSSSPDDDGS